MDTRDATQLADAVRAVGGYRWVGIYEVTDTEIGVLGWSGPSAPERARFPRDQGICGAAVAAGETVVVDDVTTDDRYLTTFRTTRAEMVVPITVAGRIVGLIDIDSERPHAFTDADKTVVESHAHRIASAWIAV